MRSLPRYRMRADQIPLVAEPAVSRARGFAWGQKHTQRLRDTLRPGADLEDSAFSRWYADTSLRGSDRRYCAGCTA